MLVMGGPPCAAVAELQHRLLLNGVGSSPFFINLKTLLKRYFLSLSAQVETGGEDFYQYQKQYV